MSYYPCPNKANLTIFNTVNYTAGYDNISFFTGDARYLLQTGGNIYGNLGVTQGISANSASFGNLTVSGNIINVSYQGALSNINTLFTEVNALVLANGNITTSVANLIIANVTTNNQLVALQSGNANAYALISALQTSTITNTNNISALQSGNLTNTNNILALQNSNLNIYNILEVQQIFLIYKQMFYLCKILILQIQQILLIL